MKAFLIASLFLATTSFAQARGTCVSYDPIYQDYCAQFPVKEACEPRIQICKWVEMNALGKLPAPRTKVEVRR